MLPNGHTSAQAAITALFVAMHARATASSAAAPRATTDQRDSPCLRAAGVLARTTGRCSPAGGGDISVRRRGASGGCDSLGSTQDRAPRGDGRCISSIAWRCRSRRGARAGVRRQARDGGRARAATAGVGAAAGGAAPAPVTGRRGPTGVRLPARRSGVGLQLAQVAVFGIGQTQLERAHLDRSPSASRCSVTRTPLTRMPFFESEIAHHDARSSRA